MRVIIWISEGTWPACIDAARTHVPVDADIVLVHLAGDDLSAVTHGAFTGLLGRRHPERDPGDKLDALASQSAHELFHAATIRLGRPTTSRELHRDREIVAMTADLLILARDSTRPGPRSLGPASRFVVDHATCPVLLVWPATG